MSQQPISIVGAGIGGLTLARCLLKSGIPAVLFDRAASAPRYSYGVTLYPSTYRPLLKVLDLDERSFRSRVAVDGASGGTGVIDSKRLIHSSEIEPDSIRAHRGKLEELLREGLDVRWDHNLEKVEGTSNGVSLRFQNGQNMEQKCVIGADGVHSETRKSLLPKTELNILPFVAFNGKRRVEASLFRDTYAPAMKDSNVIEMRSNGTLMQISVNDKTEDLVGITWVYSRASRGSCDSLYTPNRPLASAKDIPEEFFQEIDSLKDLDQPFKEVFNAPKLRKERILSWLMRTVDVTLSELQHLAAKGVYFVGDSVHAQPIIGGAGANAAITDGVQLADQIASHGVESVAEWYNARSFEWQKSVERSVNTITEMHAGRGSVL